MALGSLGTGLRAGSPTGHPVLPFASRETGARASPASLGRLGTFGEHLSLVAGHQLFEELEKTALHWTCGPGDQVMWLSEPRHR